MDTLKRSIALTVVAAVGLLAAGWFLLISPERAQAQGLQEQVAGQDQANQQLRTQLEVLRGKAEELPAKKAELAELAVKMPEEPRLPDLLRALSAAAASSGVELVSVSPGSLSPVTPPAAPAADPAAPAADPAAPAAAAPAAPAAAAAPAAGGVSSLPVTLSVTGTFHDIEQFVAELEELPRAVRLTALALAPHEDAAAAGAGPAGRRSLSANLTGEVYVVGGAPAALAAPGGALVAAPAAPSSTAAQQPAAPSSTAAQQPAAAN